MLLLLAAQESDEVGNVLVKQKRSRFQWGLEIMPGEIEFQQVSPGSSPTPEVAFSVVPPAEPPKPKKKRVQKKWLELTAEQRTKYAKERLDTMMINRRVRPKMVHKSIAMQIHQTQEHLEFLRDLTSNKAYTFRERQEAIRDFTLASTQYLRLLAKKEGTKLSKADRVKLAKQTRHFTKPTNKLALDDD